MEDIVIIKLITGAEIIGRCVSNPMNQHIQLEDALNVLVRPTEGDQVQIGFAPVSMSIAVESGDTGHPVEIYPEHILTHGKPTEAVERTYRQITSRVEIARAMPGRR